MTDKTHDELVKEANDLFNQYFNETPEQKEQRQFKFFSEGIKKALPDWTDEQVKDLYDSVKNKHLKPQSVADLVFPVIHPPTPKGIYFNSDGSVMDGL
jgi:hypothetical protein